MCRKKISVYSYTPAKKKRAKRKTLKKKLYFEYRMYEHTADRESGVGSRAIVRCEPHNEQKERENRGKVGWIRKWHLSQNAL